MLEGGMKWHKNLEPVHLIKRYYGEKLAFVIMFLLHYQALLVIPSLIGCCLFAY